MIEIAPPYIDTELDKNFKDRMIVHWDGPEKMPKPLPLDTFLDEAMDGVEAGKNEVGVGYGQVAFETLLGYSWRGTMSRDD